MNVSLWTEIRHLVDFAELLRTGDLTLSLLLLAHSGLHYRESNL